MGIDILWLFWSYMRQVFNVVTVICCLIWVSVNSQVHAQKHHVTTYSVRDGLAQSQVYSLLQDSRGYLWMGTRGGGLCRYNGSHFEVFAKDEGLANGFVNDLVETENGEIAIATEGGVFLHSGDSIRGISDKGSWQSLCSYQGQLYAGGADGLYRIDSASITDMDTSNKVQVQDLCIANGRMYVATKRDLFQFEGKGLKKTGLFNTGRDIDLNGVCVDGEGGIWIVSYGNGVFRLENGKLTDLNLGPKVFNTVCSDQKGGVWLGTEGFGVLNYNKGEWESLTVEQGLPSNNVKALEVDSWGNLWIGTSGGGVAKYGGKKFVHYDEDQGLGAGSVYSVVKDTLGLYWMGTAPGGVTVFDKGLGMHHFMKRDGFSDKKVKALEVDVEGNVWLGTEGDGLFAYRHGNFEKIKEGFEGLRGSFVRTLSSDKQGAIWVGTLGDGLTRIKDDTFENYRQTDGLSGNRVNYLFWDSDSSLWVCTNRGLDKLPKGYLSQANRIDDFAGTPLVSCCEDKNGRLWLGSTGQGVYLYDKGEKRRFGRKHGLLSDNVYFVFCDTGGYIWVGSEKGLDRITTGKGEGVMSIRHYRSQEGFSGVETCQNSVMQDEEGIWFGTVQGISRYDATADIRSEKEPFAHLIDVKLFYESIVETEFYQGDADPWFTSPIDLSLPHHQNHLTFDFEGICFLGANDVQFRWRLNGFEDSWSPATSQSTVTYSNLEPGSYAFEFQVKSSQGQWSLDEHKFAFQILRPFWSEWWFFVACSVVIVGVLFLMYKLKTRRFAERQAQLEMERNLVLLEQKALRLQMNPHFLFNCLNSIKGYISENKTKEAKLHLTKFARLMRAILDNSRDEWIAVDVEMKTLEDYLNLELITHEDKYSFEVTKEGDWESGDVSIPSMVLQPFVENCIIHGVAPLDIKGHITVSFTLEEELMRCVVTDNGVGINTSSIESKSGHRSTAMLVVQERLDIWNEKLGKTVYICRAKDLEAENKQGTVVEVTLPIKKQEW